MLMMVGQSNRQKMVAILSLGVLKLGDKTSIWLKQMVMVTRAGKKLLAEAIRMVADQSSRQKMVAILSLGILNPSVRVLRTFI